MSEWYNESFGSDYLLVYKHRDLQGAYHEVKRMMEWLELPEGSEVLDLCCGMGRHSAALTSFGFKVTGVDLSETLLAEARKLDQHGDVRWIRGDMRSVPLEGPFDAVVNLFTSFGYFQTDEDNAQVLHEIARLLKPGGQYIIDYLNPVYTEARLVRHSERREGECRIIENRCIEDGFVKKTIIIEEEGQERRYEEQVKLYTSSQFLHMLTQAGLTIEHLYGGYDASDYAADSSARMIFTGRKAGTL